jgi:uncharacterized protein YjcR
MPTKKWMQKDGWEVETEISLIHRSEKIKAKVVPVLNELNTEP